MVFHEERRLESGRQARKPDPTLLKAMTGDEIACPT